MKINILKINSSKQRCALLLIFKQIIKSAILKKIFPLFLLIFISCAARKSAPDNRQILAMYTAPFRIYGIGGYSRHVSVLTLEDAQNRYFTVMAALDTSLKVGMIYGK
jgi:hypothetical protein